MTDKRDFHDWAFVQDLSFIREKDPGNDPSLSVELEMDWMDEVHKYFVSHDVFSLPEAGLDAYEVFHRKKNINWRASIKRCADFMHSPFSGISGSMYTVELIYADPFSETYAICFHGRDLRGGEHFSAVWQECDGPLTMITTREGIVATSGFVGVDVDR